MTLLVKQGFDETVAAVAERFEAVKKGVAGPTQVEAVVVAALAARVADAMVVVSADGTIPFYTGAAARLLDLPLPARPLTLVEMQEERLLVDYLGQPLGAAESPLTIALAEHRLAEGELAEQLPNGSRRTYWVRAVPFFSRTGGFLGVGVYVNILAETPPALHPTEQATTRLG